ncbi:hypothetical protein OH492_14255 [Vibrio chagasii]|nr:hypothetical protein [Vibrio chagasii]
MALEQATSALEESVRPEASDDVAQNSLESVTRSISSIPARECFHFLNALSLMPSSNE